MRQLVRYSNSNLTLMKSDRSYFFQELSGLRTSLQCCCGTTSAARSAMAPKKATISKVDGTGWRPWFTLQQIPLFPFVLTVIAVRLLLVYKSSAMVAFKTHQQFQSPFGSFSLFLLQTLLLSLAHPSILYRLSRCFPNTLPLPYSSLL